jgi:hypothetical protein
LNEPLKGGHVSKRNVSLRIPEIGFIAGTRAALGAGLGLLLADKFHRRQRRKIGWALVAFGAATTVPLVAKIIQRASDSMDIAA